VATITDEDQFRVLNKATTQPFAGHGVANAVLSIPVSMLSRAEFGFLDVGVSIQDFGYCVVTGLVL